MEAWIAQHRTCRATYRCATKQAMLYERWREVASARAGQVAVRDLRSGRQWTFGELADAAQASSQESASIVYPKGIGVEFVLAVLGAWRWGKVACPLELDQAPPVCPHPHPGVVHLKTTSATSSGVPRLVAFTAAQLKADADQIAATMGLNPDWPNLGVISLAHSYGFSNLVLPLLLHGIPLSLLDSPLPEALRQVGRRGGEDGWTLPAVPALWRTWHEANAIPANVRLAISAGAPLPLALETEIFERTGLKLHNFYGSSECGGIAFDKTDSPRTEAALAGTPLQDVQLSANEDGYLEVRSPAVALSYWPEPEPQLANGCFRASDLVAIREGWVFLEGRTGDVINVAGRKLIPESIEHILLSHPGVVDCLVFGVPSRDSGRGEEVVACVVASASLSDQELKQFLLETLPSWQLPRDWWRVDSLEVNARGKRSRAEWRVRYLAGGRKVKPAR
jgi:long-chain acyl-CoA synthetase